jgi:predicted O-methyltransferase YrrM
MATSGRDPAVRLAGAARRALARVRAAAARRLSGVDPTPRTVAATQSLPGWCPLEKAEYLAALVRVTGARCIVEIGVYGGRSLVPMALAAEAHGGVVHAIDPWDVAASLEGDNGIENDAWWSRLDHEGIYQQFLRGIEAFGVRDTVRVLRMKDTEAIDRFADGSIDLLHVDGNHSAAVSMRYVRQWGPKLAPGGHLVMDDIDWETQRETVRLLADRYRTVKVASTWAVYQVDEGGSGRAVAGPALDASNNRTKLDPCAAAAASPSSARIEPPASEAALPGARVMIAATEARPLTDEQFFSRHYNRLSGWLNAFAHARHRALKSADKASAIEEMVGLSNRITSEANTILSGSAAEPDSTCPAEFLRRADRVCDALRQSGAATHAAVAEALQQHLAYFKAHVPAAVVADAARREPEAVYLRECVSNCTHVLADRLFNGYQWSCPDPRKATSFFDTAAVQAAITPAARTLLEDVTSLEGWCSPSKAMLLYSLARQHKPTTVVEIGIYGGRSIVPLAAALRDNGHGQVYGIETWSGSAATSFRTNIANDFWWMNIDFTKIKGDFLQFVVSHGLQDTIRVVEAASDRCAGLFDRIDLLHIDGGHSTYGAAQDVVNYVSKVPSGGIIVYDDINWPSTAAGLDILRDTCQLLHVVPAFGSEAEPGCAAFVKI